MGRNLTKTGKLYRSRPHLGSDRDSSLQIVIAKIQQSLPELKRDGNNVLGSLWADLVYSNDSTSRAGGILPQVDYLPNLAKRLQENPAQVIAEFEEIRKHSKVLYLYICA